MADVILLQVPAMVPERPRGVRMARMVSLEAVEVVGTRGATRGVDQIKEDLREIAETVSEMVEDRTETILSVGVRARAGPSCLNRSATSSSRRASASFVRSLGTCPATVRATREFGRTGETGPRAVHRITLNLT